ncbi:MAG TPA: hypothetical protein EYN38_06225 [Flavobacteriales bacterium]|nr:hypothetical protein [Flavobacteriales bacterium]HIA12893.1 hypothetical protein [Flavobacteriales bacterium]HIO72686.1 hypothetical protein [Flavobacteriales bacterium]
MKKLCLVTIALAVSLMTYSQKTKVSVSNESIGGGNNSALSVVVIHPDASEVQKEWKSHIKSYKSDGIKSGKEVFADNCKITSISDNTIDIYARVEKIKDNTVKLIIGFNLGGAYLNVSAPGYQAAEKIVYDFAIKITKAGIEDEMKEEEKDLKKKEKALEKLEKDNEKLHTSIEASKKAIEDAKKAIEQAKKDIETNLKDQEGSKKEIEVQKKTVQLVSDKLKAVN